MIPHQHLNVLRMILTKQPVSRFIEKEKPVGSLARIQQAKGGVFVLHLRFNNEAFTTHC
jgi:hypothetical protein